MKIIVGFTEFLGEVKYRLLVAFGKSGAKVLLPFGWLPQYAAALQLIYPDLAQ